MVEGSVEAGGGNHWALILYQKSDRTFYYFDSMLSFIKNTDIVVKNLWEILGFEGKPNLVCYEEIKHQQNTYDCGMYVLSFVEKILDSLNEKQFKQIFKLEDFTKIFEGITQKSISGKRKEILKIINSLKK